MLFIPRGDMSVHGIRKSIEGTTIRKNQILKFPEKRGNRETRKPERETRDDIFFTSAMITFN